MKEQSEQIITGYHAIMETLKESGKGLLYVSRKNERIDEILKFAGQRGIKIKRVDDRFLSRLPGAGHHKGCALRISPESRSQDGLPGTGMDIQTYLDQPGVDNALILVLDGITDPHNIGAILRSADCFSVSLVILPERRSGTVNETAKRISSGAAAWVPVLTVTNLSRTLDQLKEKGYWIYGAEMEGEDCRSIQPSGKRVLIMGSEGTGLHRIVRDQCDTLVRIPIHGHVDSLNVSVAAGILLYELTRLPEKNQL